MKANSFFSTCQPLKGWDVASLLSITIAFFTSIFLAGCSSSSDSAVSVTCSTSVSYKTDVSPIITSYCATNSSCHASGSNEGPGALTTYSAIYSAREAISSSVSSGDMPRGTTLTSNQKNAIICWIKNGASNN